MALEPVLPRTARITGIDREAAWVEHATARAIAKGLGHRFSYRIGEAEHLPFPDDSFDVTTCQTVLIHVPDPSAVIAEMKRVTKPGGLVAVAEPNNLAGALLMDTIASEASIQEIMGLVKLQLTCERGKAALAEGDSSLGERVAGLFVAAGLAEVDAFVNDKTIAVYPPYATDEQLAFVADAHDRVERGAWNEDAAKARRYFLAGGGTESEFADLFARGLATGQRLARACSEGTYHGVHGGAFYLVGGRKRG